MTSPVSEDGDHGSERVVGPAATIDPSTALADPAAATRPTGRAARFAWAVLAIILVGVTVLVVYALTRSTPPQDVSRASVTSSDILTSLSSLPASVDDAIGTGSAAAPITPPVLLSGQPSLQSNGRPEVLFVGAEYCPFCAAERWSLILALSRFGHFAVLHNVQSAPNDAFSGIQSFSFAHSTYSSPYLSFTGVELFSTTLDAQGGYARIASLNSGQAALLARDGPLSGALGASPMPFVDIDNRMVTSTSGFSPALLVGESQSAIVSALSQAGNPIAEGVVAAANELTAGICQATAGQPQNVCSSKSVRDADTALGIR
jgi:Domain of unknown function (DUF929)